MYKNGDIYRGEFQNGNFYGVGVYTYFAGDLYTEELKNDLRHGLGQLLKADNTLFVGTFTGGLFIRPLVPNDHTRSN